MLFGSSFSRPSEGGALGSAAMRAPVPSAAAWLREPLGSRGGTAGHGGDVPERATPAELQAFASSHRMSGPGPLTDTEPQPLLLQGGRAVAGGATRPLAGEAVLHDDQSVRCRRHVCPHVASVASRLGMRCRAARRGRWRARRSTTTRQ
jgi:hypothetical protein